MVADVEPGGITSGVVAAVGAAIVATLPLFSDILHRGTRPMQATRGHKGDRSSIRWTTFCGRLHQNMRLLVQQRPVVTKCVV
jgi:hypothetical protein